MFVCIKLSESPRFRASSPFIPMTTPIYRRLAAHLLFWLFLILFFTTRAPAQLLSGTTSNIVVIATNFTEVSRGPHSRVMQQIMTFTNLAHLSAFRVGSGRDAFLSVVHQPRNLDSGRRYVSANQRNRPDYQPDHHRRRSDRLDDGLRPRQRHASIAGFIWQQNEQPKLPESRNGTVRRDGGKSTCRARPLWAF